MWLLFSLPLLESIKLKKNPAVCNQITFCRSGPVPTALEWAGQEPFGVWQWGEQGLWPEGRNQRELSASNCCTVSVTESQACIQLRERWPNPSAKSPGAYLLYRTMSGRQMSSEGILMEVTFS